METIGDDKRRKRDRERKKDAKLGGTERSLVREKRYSGAPGPSIIPIIASLPPSYNSYRTLLSPPSPNTRQSYLPSPPCAAHSVPLFSPLLLLNFHEFTHLPANFPPRSREESALVTFENVTKEKEEEERKEGRKGRWNRSSG